MNLLNAPLVLPNGQVLGNRIMKAALSEQLATAANAPDERLSRLFARWASGGFGLLITGNVMIDRRQRVEPGNVVVDDFRDLDALRRWASAARDTGVPIWMQINHPGRQACAAATGDRPVAPSAVGMKSLPGIPAPRALTNAEIEALIDGFARTAHIAERAGFDGVQLHGAHGFLLSQFLSPRTNQRSDTWGGDIDARMRFALRVIRAVRAAVAPSFAVSIKLNSADFQRGGFTEAESQIVIGHLAAERLDLIEVGGGSYESPGRLGRPVSSPATTRAREAYFLDYAASVRQIAGSVPLAVTGGFRTYAAMEEAVSSGACDVVGLGRPSAVDPLVAWRLLTRNITAVAAGTPRLPLPVRLDSVSMIKRLQGALDLHWHTEQMHRLGDGHNSDPARSPWSAAAVMIKHNGLNGLRGRR